MRPPARAPQGVPFRVLFVCLGNICRSPSAEGTMRALLARAGLQGEIEVDSAGTGSWHTGSAPDPRALAAARNRGIALEGRARTVTRADFEQFDLLLAMDRENLGELHEIAAGEEQSLAKLRLLREFDPAFSGEQWQLDVPDPYYGGADGFDKVLDLLIAACEGLLEQIRAGTLA